MRSLTVNEVLNLRTNVESGIISDADLEAIENAHCGSLIGERLWEYRYLQSPELLSFTECEAFRIVVNKTAVQAGAPVMLDGRFVPAPDLNECSPDLPVIYSRQHLIPGLLVGYWQDAPLERVELDSGHTADIVRHAPISLRWNDRDYTLVAETGRKSFYLPADGIPDCIQPWLSTEPQKRSDLATGLKRQGYPINSLKGIQYHPDKVHTHTIPLDEAGPLDIFDELGVLVLPDPEFNAIETELGIRLSALQGTLWFQSGIFFKGTITSERLSGLTPGFYGGIKAPAQQSKQTPSAALYGSIMTDYAHCPWTPSLNRQQTDYAGFKLPLRVQMPDNRVWIKAATGFPAFAHQFNQEIVSKCYRLFNKIDIRGYAGQVSVGVSDQPIQFIIRGPDLPDGDIRPMAFLFSPSLPIHSHMMNVRILFKRDETLPGNLIQLNLHSSNLEWVARWYMAYCGRDCDGDGITLSDDPVIMKYAVFADSITWANTLSFKSEQDIELDSGEDAVRTATGRIRSAAHLIGKFDKIARRILRYKPDLMTQDIRMLITEAIQRAISAQKKNSGVDRFEGYWWLLQHLPEGTDQWLFDEESLNPHDAIDNFESVTKEYLNARTKAFYTSDSDDIARDKQAEQKFREHLDILIDTMPRHYQAAVDMLALIQTPDETNLNRMKARSRALWESAQAKANREDIVAVLNTIDRSKALWQAVSRGKTDDDNHGLSYAEAARIITTWIAGIAERNYQLTVSAAVKHLSFSILGHILDVDDLQYLRIVDGIHLPVYLNGQKAGIGMQGTRKAYSHFCKTPHLKALKLETIYRIIDIQPFRNFLWLPKTEKSQPVNHIMTVKETK